MTHARPDTQAVLRRLKDFQRITADYVFTRFYGANPTRRFLVADEVGLGKTQVARGVVAQVIDRLWDQKSRIDVVYICSNADIARQNIQRLNIPGCSARPLSSRLSLLPLHIGDLNSQRVNFIAFTPATSFEQSSGGGIAGERVLLYWLLDTAWGIAGRAAPINVLRDYVGVDRFKEKVRAFDRSKIDSKIHDRFLQAIQAEADLRTRFDSLCERFNRANASVTDADKLERTRWLGELRRFLAKICLQSLKPDLIILDEFQNFKHLLSGNDGAAELANDLFDYANEQSDVRVLLLSATPYTMLSLHHEAESDHYDDFIATLKFLAGGNVDNIQHLLKAYRDALTNVLAADGRKKLQETKIALEARLRTIMARTEREGLAHSHDGMLVERCDGESALEAKDVAGFLGVQHLADVLDQNDVVEYWKSAPYLFNFMERERYGLKAAFLKTNVASSPETSRLIHAVRNHPTAFLNVGRLRRYKPLFSGNSKLRSLLNQTVEADAWRLLWIPPAMPYHALSGAFGSASAASFTKRLVFSNWHVVPKTIAAMVSYDAERRMMTSSGNKATNTPEARKKKRGLLRFASGTDDRLTGLPVLSLIYPSITLAQQCDPRALARVNLVQLTAGEMLEAGKAKITALLDALPLNHSTSGNVDQRWYWLAPLLLDLTHDASSTHSWWDRPGLDKIWSGLDTVEPGERWADHVREAWAVARDVVSGTKSLGPQPTDLSGILALNGLAGPAVCALRAITRVKQATSTRSSLHARDWAAQIGHAFLSYFNHPEVTEMLRSSRDDEPYWSRVLVYGHSGCIQAMLDEYAHYLRDSLGLADDVSPDQFGKLARTMIETITLRTAATRIDEIAAPPYARKVSITPVGMRLRFAMRFGDERSEEQALSTNEVEPGTRKERVRAAFNSPLWPFVLATTSVGQEGLDFHPYCHAVMHWNLPANPVDLEQREGRIHRYKGHAIRKNVAATYGAQALQSEHEDPWQTAFEFARQSRAPHESDLIPYWLFSGPAQIERHVPMLPLSREVGRLHDLRKSLTLYRMVFGQSRQEDLIAFLLKQVPEHEQASLAAELRMDLSPPTADGYVRHRPQ